MRRALWLSCLGLLGISAVFLSSPAWAVERELGGARLGVRAVSLLAAPGFGQPDFIGPLGTVGGQRATPAAGRSGPARAGGARPNVGRGAGGPMRAGAGMRGRMGEGGGMGRRGPMREGAQPKTTSLAAGGSSFAVTLSQGMRRGMEGGMRMGGMRRGAENGMRGNLRAGGGTARAGGVGRVVGGGASQPAANIYWLYRRSAGSVLVLTLNVKGEVVAITLNGTLPTFSGRTSKNIGLGSDYMEVIRQYGYPDQAVTLGSDLQLTYLDDGVRFLLSGMRVTQITIGSYVAADKAGVPVPVAPPSGPTGPGLSIDELKGYM